MSTDQASKTYDAEAVQYLRPSGRQKSITTQLPVDTRDAYQAMLVAEAAEKQDDDSKAGR